MISSYFDEVLWGDFVAADTFPAHRPLLAHYTSIETLSKMLSANEIWFASPFYMNDHEEFQFGMREGARAFRSHEALAEASGSAANFALINDHFSRALSEYDEAHSLNTYVFCLSEHAPGDDDGRLSMWRAYGSDGHGVAIVFSALKLAAVETSPFIFSKVVYASTKERLGWINGQLDKLAAGVALFDRTEENFSLAAHAWLNRLKSFALFTKHKGFAEEREWRIVYSSDRDPQRKLDAMRGYLVTGQGVEPKLKVKLLELPGAVAGGALSFETLIHRLILGPSISSALTIGSVRRMLELQGRALIANLVVASSIPLRSSRS